MSPGSVVLKIYPYTSVVRESGKLDVTVRNCVITKFGTGDKRSTELHEYIKRQGPRILEKCTKAKISSHTKEFTRIQKRDRNMKHRKRDTARGVSSTISNIALAMRAGMPKVPTNLDPPVPRAQITASFAPQIKDTHASTNLTTQNTVAEPLNAALPTNTIQELQLLSISAPLEALQQILPKTAKLTRKSPKCFGFDNNDSSGESTNACPPNLMQARRKQRVGENESVKLSLFNPMPTMQLAQVEPILTCTPRQSLEKCDQQVLASDLRITAPTEIF